MKTLLPSQNIYLEEITADWALDSIRPQWWQLWNECDLAGPFQTPAWIYSWWKYFAGGSLLAIAIHHDSKLVAFAPFYVEKKGSHKILKFIGTGITDYNDILVAGEYKKHAVEIIYEYLISHRQLWDKCEFSDVNPCSCLVTDLAEHKDIIVADYTPCPILDLSAGRPSVLGNMDSLHRRKVFKSLRMLQSLGAIVFEKASLDNVRSFMKEFFVLHNESKVQRNLCAGMQDTRIRDFHMAVAEEMADNDLLALFRLKVAGVTAAVIYGFIVRDVFYSYLDGFEPSLAKLSPGNMAILYAIEYCMNAGINSFDFLRGDEKYKFLWGAQARSNYRLAIT